MNFGAHTPSYGSGGFRGVRRSARCRASQTPTSATSSSFSWSKIAEPVAATCLSAATIACFVTVMKVNTLEVKVDRLEADVKGLSTKADALSRIEGKLDALTSSGVKLKQIWMLQVRLVIGA
ncbi:hypothetical protein HYH02_001239 [Chlamydomonas schloesseri]|uniref:Uncharacterized protein n=1 Tax=Chlamydomonas schloesseri TaxID=2026947 RepID=A0A835WVJ3_9CHLO|nr:hypothetical protein HYH02_001239 [Chlamydomonas schloesseri]|eukprot:KAG2454204.1 hypothetical protein HYH02_001239 [Chlamydomonas schloesseri]